MKRVQIPKGRILEAIIYPLLIVLIMWTVFLADRTLHLDWYKYGVKPRTWEGLKGIVLMPFIHGQKDFSHIINNSIPTFVLLGTLIYFYRSIALQVTLFIWIGTGILLWNMAANTHTFHIGMSGVIYGLFGFLIISGFLKKYLPLQAISLFVAFVYGSMIWGIFPVKEAVSWEGHFSGLLMGVLLAIAYRKQGPQPPKYQYEIEEEMGIEPPDLEKEWELKRKAYLERQMKREEARQQKQRPSQEWKYVHSSSDEEIEINYDSEEE